MATEEMVVDVSRDWVLACDVQQGFMQTLPTVSYSVDYSARCRQVRALGGDCYDFIPLKNDCLALAIGDASGKGLAAALMIANVQSSLRTAALFTGDDLTALLSAVNRQAYASSLPNRYATLFYGVFDTAKQTVRYVNAGHNSPAILRCNGSVEWLESCGPPVGMFADSIYEEKEVALAPGDWVIAYTDGVVEATDQNGEEWGVQGVLQAATYGAQRDQSAADIVESVFRSMDDFSKERQTDDATLAVVRLLVCAHA